MGFDREHRLDSELNRLLDDLARPENETSVDIPGKRTRVEQLVEQLSAQEREQGRASAPGRRTLVERLVAMASRLNFDDFRVVALRDVLASLGRKRQLHAATIAAADPEVARRATPLGQVPRGKADAQPADRQGRAMWRAAERRAATLYRQAFDAGEVSPDDPAVEAALARAGTGTPLPAGVRRKMEDELGVSLERVRVHADPMAAEAARAVRAEAFTVGEDIFFADGAFAPESRAGQKLLAHELTHVVQGWQGRQDAGGPGRRVSQPGESLEQEADAVADRVARGDRGQATKPTKPTKPRARQAGAEPAPARQVRPAPASPRASTTGARTLQRKATNEPAKSSTKGQGVIQPTLKRVVQRVPNAAPSPVAGAKGAFKQQLGQASHATKAHLAPLQAGVHAAKHGHVGAKSTEHGKQEKKKTDDHKRTAHAAEQHHHETAKAARAAKHEGHPEAHDKEKVDPHSPVQFKKVDNWDKYMPQAMPNQDARERARILKLVKKKVDGERAESQKGLAQLHAAQIKQAAAVRALSPSLQGQIASAQSAALGKVAGAEASQAAAVQASFAQAQAQVNGAAGAAKGQINAAYAATVAAINTAHQAAAQKLTQGQTKATADIGTAESAQVIAIQAAYLGAHAKVDAAGATEASHAAGLGDSVPLPYDGDKLEAAQKAAHDTASGWANEIPGKMQEEAQKNIYSHQGESEQGAHDLASHQKDQVKTVYDKLKEALETAHTQALTGASTARTQALGQIDSIAASTCASLAAQSAAQVAAVHQQGAAARAGITAAGKAAQASVAQGCDKAAAGLEKGAIGVVKGAKEMEAPDPEATNKAVTQGMTQLKSAGASIAEGMKKSATQSGQGLAQQAAGAAQGMAAIAAGAKTSSAQIAQGATQSINQAAQGAAQSLQKMGQDFTKQAQGITDGGDTAFAGIVKDIQTAYKTATKTLQDGITTGVENLQKGFASAIDDKEKAAIAENAKKAADAVKPWWQKALAFVLVIVVAIVITVVVTALTGGLGTGPLMIAMIGIGSGALAGGLSSAAGQIVNNLVMGKGAFEDFSWKEVGIGALAGGLTAGLASGVSAVGGATIKAAMAGASGLGNVAIRTGVNFTTGMLADAGAQLIVNGKYEFSMQNMITTLGFSAVMSTNKFLDVQNRIGDGIRVKVGLDPIHVTAPGVEGAGEGGTGGHGEPTGHGSTQPGETGKGPGETGKGPGETGKGPGETGKGPGETGKGPGETGKGPGEEHGKTPVEEHGKTPGEEGKKPGDETGKKPGDDGKKPGEDHEQGKKPSDEQGKKPGDEHGKKPGEDGKKPGEDGKKPGEDGKKPGEDGKKPGEDGKKPGDEHGKKPGEDGKKPGEDGKKPGDEHGKPGEDGKKPGEDGKKPGEDGKASDEHGKAPGDEHGKAPGDEHGKAPGDEHGAGGRTEEQEAHDTARDGELNADGYPEGTRAKADETARGIEEGKKPGKDGLRDTEANQRGREELEKLLKDPKTTPEERAKIQKELADKLRAENDPTGKLDRDLAETKAKVEKETKPGETKPGETTPEGKKPGETPETKKPGEPAPETTPKPEAGLGDGHLTERFAGEMKGLESKWPKMSPQERANAVRDIINGHLREAGVPELKVKTAALGEGTNGHLDFKDWAITLNEGKLNAGTIDQAKLGELTNTVYHEARHGEQWYAMARHMAEGGMSPHDISVRTGIPEPVCDLAAVEPKMTPKQAADAAKYYDSVYGKNSTARNQTLNDLKNLPAKVESARAEYQKIEHDPSVSAAEKQAKYDAWVDAYNKSQKAYQDYRNLPEEADAWAVGDAAEAAFKNGPKPTMDPSGPKTERMPTTGKTEPTTGKTEPTTGKTEPTTGKTEPEKPASQVADSAKDGPLGAPDRAKLPAEQQPVYDKAWEFYRSQGMSDARIEGHLRGIDFSKPVEVITLPKGTVVQQTQPPGAPQGSYYAPPGTEPGKLGISPTGDVRGPDGETVIGHVSKQTKLYVTTEDIVVLKSSAGKIEDNWSMHEVGSSSKTGKPVPFLAEGGGTQYFTTKKPELAPYTEPKVTSPTAKVEPEAAPMMKQPSGEDPTKLTPPGGSGDEFVNALKGQLDAGQQRRLELMTNGKSAAEVHEMFGGDIEVARAKLEGSNLPTDLIQQRLKLSAEARRAFDAKWNQMVGGDRAPSSAKVNAFKKYLQGMSNRAGGDLDAGLVVENGKLPGDLSVSAPKADDFPKSWGNFDPDTNAAFKAKLESFRGNDNLGDGYSGGEGTVFPGADRTTALKRWYQNRLQDMPESLQKLRDAASMVEGHPELSSHVEVVKIHEVESQWIIRDWVDDSRPIGDSPGSEHARTAAIDALQRKGSLSKTEQDVLNKLQNKSDNLHWSPSRGKIVIIDMQ